MCKNCGCSSGRNAQIQLYVKGYDKNDAKDVERSLLGLSGVYHVHIHAHDGQTTIDYNPSLTSLNDITSLMFESGLQPEF